MEHMTPLKDIEEALVSHARTYVAQQRQMMEDLRPFKDELEEAVQVASRLQSDREYMGNPVDAFKLMKRLASDWDDLNAYMEQQEPIATILEQENVQWESVSGGDEDTPQWLDSYDNHKPPVSRWGYDVGVAGVNFDRNWTHMYENYAPTAKDVHGSLVAFLRLQDIYFIEARHFADGDVPMIKPSKLQLSAADCMAIAKVALENKRYVRMKEWSLEALRLIEDPSQSYRHGNTSRAAVYEYLAYVYFLDNDAVNALKYTQLLLEASPDSAVAQRNIQYYEWYANKGLPMPNVETTYMNQARALIVHGQQQAYVQACVNKKTKLKGVLDESKIRCFYKRDHPLLVLKPLKVSQMHDNPPVLVFHDFISNNTAEKLKKMAIPRMKVSRIVHMVTGDLSEAFYRVSKNMFLLPDVPSDMVVNDALHPLFEAATGLSMKYAETLQLNNYGLGGQYETHHDYGEPGTLLDKDAHGNRLATLLFYLSQVEYGGHTVFPHMGLSLSPQKGDAVFWYNLHRNGSGIVRTWHASCPVLSGSKWVANKWIRMAGNEFKYRCSRNRFE